MNFFRANFRSVMIIGTVIGGIAAATYPIIISPYLNPTPWKEVQSIGRKGIDREKIQPGATLFTFTWVCAMVHSATKHTLKGMKVWTDPFEKKKD